MGGTSQQSQTTTTQNPLQAQLYGEAAPFLSQFAANPPSLPANTVAPFDPSQIAGQTGALGAAAGPLTSAAGSAADMTKFLSGDVLSPQSNPYLSQYIKTATDPIYQNLTETVLPAIRSGATQSGQTGGSREGIAEGLATRGAGQAAGATAANIANQGYGQGLNALLQNLSLLPRTMGAELMPAMTTSGVGDVRQQMTQALLGQSNLQEMWPQLLPLLMGQSLAGIGSGIQPQGATTTASGAQFNPLQAAGLGISGLGLFGGMGPFGAFGAFSDRRLKRDIVRVGERNGIPWYRFRYLKDDAFYEGIMADEAPREAVFDICGFAAVDYGRL